MSGPFIIDSHAHIGLAGALSLRSTGHNGISDPVAAAVLSAMDRLGIALAVCSDQQALMEGGATGIERMRRAFDESAGRILCLAVFDPREGRTAIREIEAALKWDGLVGIKIHPPLHRTPAESPAYRPVWELAAANDLPILTHTWSVSDYNPQQALATPDRFAGWVRDFPRVRLVLGHAGGRGAGRFDAVKLAKCNENVFLDFAGDIFDYRLVEDLMRDAGADKVLFGSDFPWTGPADHLTRILLADISDGQKENVLRLNALRVYTRLAGIRLAARTNS